MRLTIDVRKAFDTGIGTYIRELVPRVICRRPATEPVTVLIGLGQSALHDYLAECPVAFIEVGAQPFTLQEQWELRQLMPRAAFSGPPVWPTLCTHKRPL